MHRDYQIISVEQSEWGIRGWIAQLQYPANR
jgi:hypothetical protein